MNLFDSILQKASPIQNPVQNFMSGFTPSPDIFTGKTTSEKIASWEIKTTPIAKDKVDAMFWKKQPSALSSFDPNTSIIEPMLRPIETGINKVISGTTSFIKSGQEELASRKTTRQNETEKKINDTVDELAWQGYTQEQIMSVLDDLNKEGFFKDKPWVIEWMSQRLFGSLQWGVNRVQEAQTAPYSTAEKSIATWVAIPSTLVSAPFNALFGGAIESGMDKLPDEAKQKIAEASQAYDLWAQQNPRAAFNVKTAWDIATIAPTSAEVRRIVTKPITELWNVIKKEAPSVIKKPFNAVRDKVIPKDINIPEWLSKAEQDALREISPKDLTPTELEKAKISWKVETGKWITGEKYTYNPDAQDLEIAKTASPYIKKGASTSENVKNINKAIEEEAKTLESSIASSNPIIPKRNIAYHIKNAVSDMMEHPEMVGDNLKIAQNLINKYKAIIEEEWGTALWILRSRKRFDQYVSSKKPKVFDASKVDVYSNAVRAIRDRSNELLDSMVKNVSAKKSLKKQHLLYKARDMIAWNKDISTLWKVLKNPVVRTIWAWVVWATWYDLLTK